MDWAQQKRRAIFFYWWAVGRFVDWWNGSHISEHKKLPIENQSLYMAACRSGFGLPRKGRTATVRRLIELGADPAVGQWLPLRMAARAGDLPFVEWLLSLSRPSDYAVSDARAWAQDAINLKHVTKDTGIGQAAVIERLRRFSAEGR